MKRIYQLLMLIASFTLLSCGGGDETSSGSSTPDTPEIPDPQPPTYDNDATALAKKLGWGWNLGNHFDTSSGEDGKRDPYWDGATPTAGLYTKLKAAGASTVRIPVTWGNYQSTTDGQWTIDANFMAAVKQNVEWAEAAGLNVILNIHHDEY